MQFSQKANWNYYMNMDLCLLWPSRLPFKPERPSTAVTCHHHPAQIGRGAWFVLTCQASRGPSVHAEETASHSCDWLWAGRRHTWTGSGANGRGGGRRARAPRSVRWEMAETTDQGHPRTLRKAARAEATFWFLARPTGLRMFLTKSTGFFFCSASHNLAQIPVRAKKVKSLPVELLKSNVPEPPTLPPFLSWPPLTSVTLCKPGV